MIMSINVEIDYDTADKILVEALKEQYSNVSMILEQRYDDTKNNYGMFHNDKEEDIVAIKELLKSFEDVLRYNMLEEDFKEWSESQ
jgi:ribonucleotide monophosphatase NagD (HAD superfamily)